MSFNYQEMGAKAILTGMKRRGSSMSDHRLKWFVWLALLMQGVSAWSSPVTEFPFKLRAGLIWVQVDVTRGAKALNFILDSGAEASVISLQAAQRLNLALGQPVTVRGINTTTLGYWTDSLSARLGGIHLSTNYLAMDLSALSDACHRRVDGLIGADFFAGRVVQIDFAAEKIRLLENGGSVARAEVLPLQIEAARLRVPVEVVGLGKAWARLDTGCASALHWAVSPTALAGQSSSEELGVGVSSILIRQNAQSVCLGRLTLSHISTGLHAEKLLAGEAGLLGAGLLSHFSSVTIDEPGGQLILESYSAPKPTNRR
jgi:Aspartyl protease